MNKVDRTNPKKAISKKRPPGSARTVKPNDRLSLHVEAVEGPWRPCSLMIVSHRMMSLLDI